MSEKMKKEKKNIIIKIPKKKINKLIKLFGRGADIFFADAKQSWERVMSVFSALFWTWLEFSFLKFFFIFIFGIAAHASTGDIAYSWDIMIQNREFVNIFIKIFFVLVFITRIPIHYKKIIEVKK